MVVKAARAPEVQGVTPTGACRAAPPAWLAPRQPPSTSDGAVGLGSGTRLREYTRNSSINQTMKIGTMRKKRRNSERRKDDNAPHSIIEIVSSVAGYLPP